MAEKITFPINPKIEIRESKIEIQYISILRYGISRFSCTVIENKAGLCEVVLQLASKLAQYRTDDGMAQGYSLNNGLAFSYNKMLKS